jgi:hypothetical protein
MAELDIKGFVTPEQTFEGLYKTGEILAAQKAAKAKAAEVDKVNQAALAKYAENKFNTKDYLSGTVADPNITQQTADALNQVNSFISQNKGATESQIQLIASPLVRKIADYSEKSKVLKSQMESGIEQMKGKKGVDVDKFRTQFINRAWGVKDGQVPDNLNNVDITHNYIDDVLNNDDIYNAEAVRESIKNAKPIDYQYSQTTRNKAGVEKSTLYDAKSQPFYQPITDDSGKPTGQFEPKSVPFTDNDQVVMHEWLGDTGEKTKAPIKLLDQNAFEQIFSPTNNPAAAAYLRNEVKKHTEGKAPLNSSQAEALSRAIAYDLVRDNMTEPASIKLKEEQKQPITKISVSTGGGDKTLKFRDIYKEVIDRFEKEAEGVERGGRAAFVPINNLEPDAGTIITDMANKRNPGRTTKYNASDLYIVRTGDMKGREIRDTEGNLVMPFNKAEDMNPEANYGTKVKQKGATTPSSTKSAPKGTSNKKVTNPDLLRQLNQK